MRILLIALTGMFLCSCSSVTHTLKYGYLPGSDFQYYAPLEKVDLKGEKYKLKIVDNRKGNSISCYDRPIPRDTELENSPGIQYFENYFKAMIEFNNGLVVPTAEKTINVQLNAISGDIRMVLYGHVYGLVEFEVSTDGHTKKYCSEMVDGDKDAPLGAFSMDTRKGAFRKLVSGSTRRALEQFMHDLVAYKN